MNENTRNIMFVTIYSLLLLIPIVLIRIVIRMEVPTDEIEKMWAKIGKVVGVIILVIIIYLIIMHLLKPAIEKLIEDEKTK